jgi:hypothetical protein
VKVETSVNSGSTLAEAPTAKGKSNMDLTTALITGAWSVWATYGEAIKSEARKRLQTATGGVLDKALRAWDRVDWKLSAAKYQQALEEIYGTIRILGKVEPVSLEGIFTDVVILEKPTAFYRYDIKRLREEPQKLQQRKLRKGGLRLVKDPANKRLFILGKPGAGKTTFLKYLTIQAAKGNLERTPIFVSLKEWADSGLPLMDYLVRQFDICDFPDASQFVELVLRKGQGLVMFDGLDEVNQEGNQRAKMIDELRNFSNKYSNAQCLVTCRIAATEYTFDRFIYVELADFTDRQVEVFVRKWFKGERKKRALFDEAFHRSDNHRLQELARTPLLLSLLCLSFDATLEFPQRRVEIYEEALEALLKKWDTTRSIQRGEIYRGLSLGRKRQMFARIAAKSFQEGKYFLSQAELSKQIVGYLRQLPQSVEEDIDGESVLRAIEAQHGIFTERAHKIYSFSHLTFQEYFTAKQIVSDTTGKALSDLLVTDHLIDPTWREVILLTVSLLDNADDFFSIFIDALDKYTRRAPLLVKTLQWADLKAKGHPHIAAAVRAYYCYLVFNLIDQTPSFRRGEVERRIIDSCFRLAQRVDRTGSLTKAITTDTLDNLKSGYQSLHTNKPERLDPLPPSVINLDSSLSLHLTYVFFSVLTIANLRDSIDTSGLSKALQAYFVELRRLSLSQSESVDFGTPLTECPSEVRIAIASRDLTLLPDSAPTHSWAELGQGIRSIILHNCEVEEPLSEIQSQRILTFFELCLFLLDCLNLAVVSNRSRVEERLLLPLSQLESRA